MAEDNLNTQPAQMTEDEILEHNKEVFLLEHVKGYTVKQIAVKYAWPVHEVRAVLKSALKDQIIKDRQKALSSEAAKLNAMEAVAMKSALNEHGVHDAKAIKSVLAIMARRSRMFGYDMPSKLSLTDADGKNMQNVLFYLPDNQRDGCMPHVPALDEVAV